VTTRLKAQDTSLHDVALQNSVNRDDAALPGAALVEFAPAKVNLTLRVLRRRPDGYHELDSLVAFAKVGDRLSLQTGPVLDVVVRGPTAGAAGPTADNLVAKTARALSERVPGLTLGRFVLDKRLPVAAGLGGGSSDAAAALRLLARANGLSLDDPRVHEAAVATGADVPVCLTGKARVMRGIGELLSEPIDLPRLPAILVNPGVAVPTRDVFQALKLPDLPAPVSIAPAANGPDLIESITRHPNDLEAPALALQPVIADVLSALRALPGCSLARMSGSGATCFALFGSSRAAEAGARVLRAARPAWWVRACVIS
jgi:4-diphosphocytidyl-2-C-methyl-D-erythritol kinase